MCGRFCIAADPGEISERYGVDVPPDYRPRYNIAPAQPVLTIRKAPDRWEGRMTEWGFRAGPVNRIINARVESVHEKPLFKNLFPDHRCLIPAAGYYEWKHEGREKTPYYCTPESGDLISFAGLIRPSREGDQAVILTTGAIAPCSEIHDRMPVILGPGSEQKFLSDGEITPAPLLRVYEVSPRVNQWTADDPDLIRPAARARKQSTLADLL
jgi:putative SOS response-associated peptidase YedK